jgi:hypothetical protein
VLVLAAAAAELRAANEKEHVLAQTIEQSREGVSILEDEPASGRSRIIPSYSPRA